MDVHSRSESEDVDQQSDDTLQENVDTLDMCYMSISYFHQKCGAALYYPNSGRILMVEQIEDNEYDNIVALVLQIVPNHLIINANCETKLIDILHLGSRQAAEENGDHSTSDSQPTPGPTPSQRSTSDSVDSEAMWRLGSRYQLHFVSHTMFAYENSKNRILSLNFKNRPFVNQKEKFLFLSSLIDFSDNNTFRALGALLRFLDNHLIDLQNQTMGTTVEASSISPYTSKQLMAIERNTYESLQVFRPDWHPSVAKQGINHKEGLSLFGLFNCCVSKIGVIYLRKIFLLPTQEIDIISDRLNTIEFFMNKNNLPLIDNLRQQLKHVKGVAALFNRLNSDSLTLNDLKTLQTNLRYALKIKNIVGDLRTDLQIFNQIRETFDREIDDLMKFICKVVDFDKSMKSQSFEIHAGINEQLDKSKYVYNQIPKMLDEVAKEEVLSYRTINQCNCVYLPQIGFLTSVPLVPDRPPPHQTEDKLKFMINIGDRAYYKTPRTEMLDSMFGDIQSDIVDLQMHIITELIDLIWVKRHIFISIVRCCAKLDALIAMSRTALEYNFVRPMINNDETIDIVEGRHPLIELMFKTFVANDYRSGGQWAKTKLITGPNACGKSVYLKQICLIVYMAHIGSYVPAMTANIPVIDRMFTRIQTPESVSMRLSTFILDLKQMSNAAKYATKRSIVVIDEFGKGTQPTDGVALMASSINHLMHPERSPHLVVSSHFKSLASVITRKELVECLTFELMSSENRIHYLYKLIDGLSTTSIASYIAQMEDIPDNIITKATNIFESMTNNKAIDCLNIQESDTDYRTLKEICQNFFKTKFSSDETSLNFYALNFAESFRSDSEE